MLGIINPIVTLSAGYAYPLYASYKSLRTNRLPRIEKWLMYWVLLGAVLIVETVLGWALAYVPLYAEVRNIFLLWLVLPQCGGAEYLYVKIVHPFLSLHEEEIDETVRKVHTRVRSTGVSYANQGMYKVQEIVFGERARPQQAAQGTEETLQIPPRFQSVYGAASKYIAGDRDIKSQLTMLSTAAAVMNVVNRPTAASDAAASEEYDTIDREEVEEYKGGHEKRRSFFSWRRSKED